VKRRILSLVAVTVVLLAPLVGCTTFGAISWRNFLVLMRPPDGVRSRITSPLRPDARIAALWVGHATVLLQLDDKFILTDPVFTRYVGGVSPRLVQPGIAVEHLPPLDAVLVSHRHFDHLSKGSLRLIGGKTRQVLTPRGAGTDIPAGPRDVTELGAWHSWSEGGLRITAVPVVHSGDRLPGDGSSHRDAYCGFIIEYRGLAVFFAGDTAFDANVFHAIAARFPAIDLALLPIGPIAPEEEMLPHHMNPTQAIGAARILRSAHVMPIHFDTFINSLDDDQAVAAEFVRAATEAGDDDLAASLMRIGEQRVFVSRN
jgi:N-acyl-phosphatidylethanolamine-hydrolysing phospholipase D